MKKHIHISKEFKELIKEPMKYRIHSNPNDLIVEETIKLFEPVNMGVAKLYGNKTERRDVLILHNKLKDKLPLVIAFLPTYNASLKPTHTGRVFGKVIKPSELLTHLQDVFEAKRKLDNKLLVEIERDREDKRKRQEDLELKKQRDSYTLEQKEELKRKSDAIRRTILGF